MTGDAVSYETKCSIAKLLFELERYAEATPLFEELLRADDRFIEVWFLTGACYVRQGEGDGL